MINATATTIEYIAWDYTNNAPKTGDGANHALTITADGTTAALGTPTGTEISSSNNPGLYKATITGGENTGVSMCLHGKSSNSGIAIIPVRWTNFAGDSYTLFTSTASTELASAPAVGTATLQKMIQWCYVKCRNYITETATVQTIKKADGTTTLSTAVMSDDGTTFTKNADT